MADHSIQMSDLLVAPSLTQGYLEVLSVSKHLGIPKPFHHQWFLFKFHCTQ